MTQLKLSRSDIPLDAQARVFLMYWGQEFVYSGSFGTRRKVAGITRGWDIKDDTIDSDSYRVDKCTLILTHFANISEEHLIQVARMEGLANPVITRGFDFTVINDDSYCLTISHNGSVHLTKYNKVQHMDSHEIIIQFLASMGYAVKLFFGVDHPANGCTALDVGLAYDADVQLPFT